MIILVSLGAVFLHLEPGVRPDGEVAAVFHVQVDLAVSACDDGVARPQAVSLHRAAHLLPCIDEPGVADHEFDPACGFGRPGRLRGQSREEHDERR